VNVVARIPRTPPPSIRTVLAKLAVASPGAGVGAENYIARAAEALVAAYR